MSNEVNVTEIGDEEIDVLFGDKTPDTTFKAENLPAAEKKEDKPSPTKETNTSEKEELEEEPQVTEVLEEDHDTLFNDEEEEKVEKKEVKKATKEEKAKEAESINFKNLVDHLVDSGKWADFEGREDLEEINEEQFYVLTEQQDSHRLDSKFNDILDKTGNYGKAIIEFEKNGGNPSQLLELFREQRDIQNVDLSDADNQEEVIRAYYEAQGEDDEWINDYVNSLKDRGDDAFKKDAEKKHSKLLESNKAEVEALQKEQAEYKKSQEQAQLVFHSNVKKAIHSTEDWSNAEKKDLEKFLLNHDKKLNDGRVVNGLFVKMLEIQQDASKYIKFAKFIQDMDKYEANIKKKTEKETTKSTWKMIKAAEGEGFKKTSIVPDEVKSKKVDPFSITFKS